MQYKKNCRQNLLCILQNFTVRLFKEPAPLICHFELLVYINVDFPIDLQTRKPRPLAQGSLWIERFFEENTGFSSYRKKKNYPYLWSGGIEPRKSEEKFPTMLIPYSLGRMKETKH